MSDSASSIPRRQFLRQSVCAGFGMAGLMSTMGTLRLFNAALSAQTTEPDDYKALICIFLFGGNDGNNMLVPYDQPGYDTYANARGVLALPREGLLEVPIANSDGRQFALHPNMAGLQTLAQQNKAALVANVGTLVAPITRAEYRSGGAAIPPYLFSHNDQQVQWQTSVPDSPKKVGWGGRLADLTNILNGNAQISMNISIAGNNFFQVGNEVAQFQVTTNGSIGLSGYTSTSAPRRQQYQALNDTLGMSYSHLFEREYAAITQRAISTDTLLKTTLAATPLYNELFPLSTTSAPDQPVALTRLASQLRMILRLITARQTLGLKRQIFFCSMGGFDTHDDQLNDHGNLMRELSNAVTDFYQASVNLGVGEKVTLFTGSDFNRTFSSNGKGSDHAWGSHQFVVGGAVQGGQIFGTMPVLQSSGPDDTGNRGSWIPTTSVDEYSATLARWFGVEPGLMHLVLPNIARFRTPDLGFMGPA